MPPVHPQWIDAHFVNGPRDGETQLIHRDRRLVMFEDKPGEMEEHKVAHAYLARGDGRHFDYVGKKSMHEINALIRGGQLHPPEPDDSDAADWWKK